MDSDELQATHMEALNPFNSKLMTLTARGGLWTFSEILALWATQLTAPSKTDANSCLKSNKCRELAKKNPNCRKDGREKKKSHTYVYIIEFVSWRFFCDTVQCTIFVEKKHSTLHKKINVLRYLFLETRSNDSIFLQWALFTPDEFDS